MRPSCDCHCNGQTHHTFEWHGNKQQNQKGNALQQRYEPKSFEWCIKLL